MKCSCCGKEISQNDKFCNYCGQNNEFYVEPAVVEPEVVQSRNNEYNNSNRNTTYNPAHPRNNEYAGYRNNQSYQNNSQGYQQTPQQQFTQNNFYQQTRPAEGSGLSICALVFAILGGWLGLILGIIGLCTNKEDGNRKRCTAALIIVACWFVIGLIIGFAS